MSNNNIDYLFKRALQEQKHTPPDYIWENIEKKLNRRRQLVGAWLFSGVAAAALLFACLTLWQLKHQEAALENIVQMTLPPDSLLDTVTPDESRTSVLNEMTTSLPDYEQRTKVHPKEIIRQTVPVVQYISQSNIPNLVSQTSLPELTINKKDRLIPLTSGEALKNNLKYQTLLSETPAHSENKTKIKIGLSAHFNPTYSSGNYSSSVKNPRGYSYTNDQMNGILNAGGGVRLSVNTGKRFSVQTGVFYSRMGQETSDKNVGTRVSTMALTDNSPRMVTPLGNIKTIRKGVAYRSPEAIVLNSMSASDESLEQVFNTLEIPLHLRYNFNNNKILLSVNGGFSGNFIVDNKVYLKSGDTKELLGRTEDIRNFNLSTECGLGIEYPFTNKIRIMLEPGFKYYLRSLSRNEDIDFKPYIFTFSAGIGIEF